MKEVAKTQDEQKPAFVARDDALNRHIAELAWRLANGQDISVTVPADEITKAESYLTRIGIAAPLRRSPKVTLIFDAEAGSGSTGGIQPVTEVRRRGQSRTHRRVEA